eukprot:scaffold129153_cov87-Phaeocystis_antarctica.AAC.1
MHPLLRRSSRRAWRARSTPRTSRVARSTPRTCRLSLSPIEAYTFVFPGTLSQGGESALVMGVQG